MPADPDDLGARLVRQADSDRRALERELHEGAQQELVAIAVQLQLAMKDLDEGDGRVRPQLEQVADEVRRAAVQLQRLARQIYPPLAGVGGLTAAVRSAAAALGVRATIDVDLPSELREELLVTVYFCSVAAFQDASRVAVSVRHDERELAVEISGDGSCDRAAAMRDRVEALGGTLSVRATGLSVAIPWS